jgi:hypothetical protein
MIRTRLKLSSETALRWVLSAGFLLMLAANLPGHLSYDSVIELYEGRFHQRVTWAPAFYSWVLGFFDHIVPGTGLYVVASGLLFFASLASLAHLRGRVSWIAPVVAAGLVLLPDVLIYQAIIWKDVLFANVSVAGMICLAHAAKTWDDRPLRWTWLTGALLLLAGSMLTRQNGLIVDVLGAIALGWTAARDGWKAALRWGLGGLVTVVVVAQLIGVVATPARVATTADFDKGMRILRHYDLLGALSVNPNTPMPVIDAANPGALRLMREGVKHAYSPARIDYLDNVDSLQKSLWSLSDETVAAAWRDLIIHHPVVYARERLGVFRWTFLTPVIDRCLPVYVGVDAPADKMSQIGLQHRFDPTDQSLMNYTSWFLDTPAFSHLTYAVVGLLVAGFLLWRRDPADVPMAALMLAGIGFAGSFLIISLACDYRYLYFLDLSAITGVFYLAVDPSLWRKRRPA